MRSRRGASESTDSFTRVLSEPVVPFAVLGESVTIIGSPDALPGICPLLAFDDIFWAAEVPPLRISPFCPFGGTCFSILRALPG